VLKISKNPSKNFFRFQKNKNNLLQKYFFNSKMPENRAFHGFLCAEKMEFHFLWGFIFSNSPGNFKKSGISQMICFSEQKKARSPGETTSQPATTASASIAGASGTR